MQKPIDTTQRINQLLLRASKPLNTLGERKGVQEEEEEEARWEPQGQTVMRGTILNEAEREENDETEEMGECG